MTTHPLLPMPSPCLEKEKSYALIGRALAFSSEFECNCRILAHLDSQENIDATLKSGTLHNKIKALSSRYNICESFVEDIDKARSSRNFIVHEIPLDHIRLLETASGRTSFRAMVVVHMGNIIVGNHIVLDMINILRGEYINNEGNLGSDINEYLIAVHDWLDGN